MTEQRVSDLPYGQLGDATYDVEQQSWTFARQFSYDYGIQPVDLPRQCLPPTLPHDSTSLRPSHRVQNTALTKRFPELLPASIVTSELKKSAPDDADAVREALSTSSSLIGVGRADDRTGNRTGVSIDIIAVASGKAGEVLRLIRPQINTLSWPGGWGIHLEVMDPEKPLEECYWASNGGPIRQIRFAVEGNGQSKYLASASSWLAVRQLNSTTILRPVYQRQLAPAILPNGSALKYSPSRLKSNPVATLPITETGGLPHADMTFNPFYVRQVAVLDQGGSWSVWDIEGRPKNTVKLERSREGHIFDDFNPETRSGAPDIADGWGRILWAGDVNTLIVCGRCHLAVFNIKAEPARLQTPEAFISMTSGWILDVKQNVRQLNHLFVLTSARLFWLEIDPENGEVIILFSCRHFRDEDGENMKLEILTEGSSCTVLLYSAANILINTYRLSTARNQNGMPQSLNSSFAWRDGSESHSQNKMHSIAMIASQYAGETHNEDSLGFKYRENDILFYQLFTLSTNLELQVTLCSTPFPLPASSGSSYEMIIAPSIKKMKSTTRPSRIEKAAGKFVIPDGMEDESDEENVSRPGLPRYRGKYRHEGRSQVWPYAIDLYRVFRNAFRSARVQADEEHESAEDQAEDALQFIRSLPECIKRWRNDENGSLTTLIELVQSLSFSGDIDDVAAAFGDILGSLPEEAETESDKILTVSPINGANSSSLTASVQGSDVFPDLMVFYNHLLDLWVTSLPRKTPGSIRFMQEKLIRKIATELALSSTAISMRPPPEQNPHPTYEPDAMTLDRSTPFSSQPVPPESSQQRARSRSVSLDPGLPTPAYTQSLVSEASTEGAEDPAISLLRTYVDFQPQPPNGATVSRVQSHWVSGSDPDHYNYEAVRKAHAVASGDDEDSSARRKRERRQKKAEKNMNRYQRAGTGESASQPPGIASSQATWVASQPTMGTIYSSPVRPGGGSQPTRASKTATSQPGRSIGGGSQPVWAPNIGTSQLGGSQPAWAPNIASSQLPMTQAEEGQFGGMQSVKKKKGKKRKQGF